MFSFENDFMPANIAPAGHGIINSFLIDNFPCPDTLPLVPNHERVAFAFSAISRILPLGSSKIVKIGCIPFIAAVKAFKAQMIGIFTLAAGNRA